MARRTKRYPTAAKSRSRCGVATASWERPVPGSLQLTPSQYLLKRSRMVATALERVVRTEKGQAVAGDDSIGDVLAWCHTAMMVMWDVRELRKLPSATRAECQQFMRDCGVSRKDVGALFGEGLWLAK